MGATTATGAAAERPAGAVRDGAVTDWATPFDESEPARGATDEEIAGFVASVGSAVIRRDRADRLQDNP